MYSRILTFTGATDIEGGVAYLTNEALPLLSSQHGYRGVTASADRQNGLFGIMSVWDSEADRAASESAMGKAREEAVGIVGGTISIENYEVLAQAVAKPVTVGCALFVLRAHMAPETVDGNIEFFTNVVLPEIAAAPGFCALRNMGDRATGVGVVGSIWETRKDLDNFAAGSPERQARAESRGVTWDDTSIREILFADMPR